MFSQENRTFKLKTPAGADAFILVSFKGREAISELFDFELQVVWQRASPLRFADILGKFVTLQIDDAGKTERFINGIVYSVEQGVREREHGFTYYTLHVAPSTWLLTRNIQTRIFQKLTAPDIIAKVISDMGQSATYKNTLTGTYTEREYCVQYRESDFAFISRLMESEGIFYFFQHEDGKHTLVVGDTKTSFQDLPGDSNLEFEDMMGGEREKCRVFEWAKEQRIRSGKFAQNDWNFETPSTSLLTTDESPHPVAQNGSLEIYEHPGGYMLQTAGEPLTRIRLQAENTPGLVTRGKSWHYGICPAFKFSLTHHFSDNGGYVLTSVEHAAQQPLDARKASYSFEYENRFTTIPVETNYRPPSVTPRPRIDGVQTAIVVGPEGEEIYTDKYGRVKAQFHWDRLGNRDENSSCWMRVATFWAGKNWGAIHIPRIGQEVIIDFEEGDVDRPIIVGSVYNAEQMPPFDLPGNKTQSGIVSRSSKGGNTGTFNQMRFEDAKGSEQVYLHAEKDLDIIVENNESRKVGNDRTKEVEHDESVTIKHDHKINIHNDDLETVGHNQTILVRGDRSKQVNGDERVSISKDQTINIGKSLDAMIAVSETREAGTMIQLKVGESSITLDQTGVTIKGMVIQIDAKMMASMRGLLTNVNADAIGLIHGAVVMIN